MSSAAAAAGAAGAAAGSRPSFEGYLTKRSRWVKEWRRRYFRLVDHFLYFSKEKDGAPHGFIDLKDCLTVKSAEDKVGKQHCFEVATPDETFFICADTDAEKDEWIGAIGKAIVKFSNCYHGDDDDAGSDSDDDDA